MKSVLNLSLAVICILMLSVSGWAQDAAFENMGNHSSDLETVRFGFTNITLGTINGNDAKAAIRIWAKSLTKEMNIPADPIAQTYTDISQIKKDLLNKELDVLYLTTLQWVELRPFLAEDAFLSVKLSGNITEEYVLLVHRQSRITGIQDLKGGTLNILENARTSLAKRWLSVYIAEKGLGKHEYFFKQVNIVQKTNNAVLPVFFRQADACLVTRKGFEIMSELNPQISQQLKILAESPPYVPTIFCFRKDYHSPMKPLVMNNMQKMVETTSGSQLLTIFQIDGLTEVTLEDLNGILALFKNDLRLSVLEKCLDKE